MTFSASVANTLRISAMDCRKLLSSSMCSATGGDACTNSMNGPFAGVAGALIFESMVVIHNMYADYHTTLFNVASTVCMSLGELIVSNLCSNCA